MKLYSYIFIPYSKIPSRPNTSDAPLPRHTETTGLPKYSATPDTEKWPRGVQTGLVVTRSGRKMGEPEQFHYLPYRLHHPPGLGKETRDHL